jgi:RHS repeat-associated protein
MLDQYSEESDGQLLKHVFSGTVRLARLGGVPPRTVSALSTVREGLQRGMALLALGALALGAALAARGGQVLRLARGALAVGLAAALASTSCGPGAPVYPEALYYVGDHLQSTSLVTDASGKVVAEAAYDVWGQQVVGTTEPYTYTGHEWDAEAGLYYAGNRYYDPKLGRFLSVDPAALDNPGLGVEDPQALNPYAYARNTPTSLADRDGRLPHVVVGALAGAVVNTGIYLVKGAITGESYTVSGALAAAASGAVAGALGAATGGLSLVGSAVAAGASGVASGVVERGITTGSAAETFSPKAMAVDAAMSVATFGVVKGGGHLLSKVAGPVRERMGAALSKFTSRGQGGCSGQCKAGSNGCFVAGTLVLLASGQLLPIEQVQVGDKVLAPASAAQPTQVASFEVLETSKRQVEWVVDLTLEDATGHREMLTATPDHPVLRHTATDTEWVDAAQVRASDTLASPQGTLYVRNLQTRHGPFEVFNLTVDSAHAYLVGSARLVVHNGAYGNANGTPSSSSRVVYPRGPGASEGPLPRGYTPVSRWVDKAEAELWIKNEGTHIPAGVGRGSGRVYVTAPGEPRPGMAGPIKIDFAVDSAALNSAGKNG